MMNCKYCKNGWFDDQRFGADVECINGILIDIDVYHDGYPRNVFFPVAPCHPNWKKQCKNKYFVDDSQERLAEHAEFFIIKQSEYGK